MVSKSSAGALHGKQGRRRGWQVGGGRAAGRCHWRHQLPPLQLMCLPARRPQTRQHGCKRSLIGQGCQRPAARRAARHGPPWPWLARLPAHQCTEGGKGQRVGDSSCSEEKSVLALYISGKPKARCIPARKRRQGMQLGTPTPYIGVMPAIWGCLDASCAQNTLAVTAPGHGAAAADSQTGAYAPLGDGQAPVAMLATRVEPERSGTRSETGVLWALCYDVCIARDAWNPPCPVTSRSSCCSWPGL